MQTLSKAVLLAMMATVWAAPAFAEEEEDEGGFSANIGFVSDYTFRGISQTNEDPALQGGVDYGWANGLYVGAWGSNVDFEPGDGTNLEVDTYIGWAADLNDQVALDLQFVRYWYPGGESDYEYNEFIANLTLAEAITFTLGYSNDAFGSDETGIYYGVSGSYGLPWYELSLNGSFGYYDLDDVLGDSYNDYSIGLSKEFGPVEGALTYIDTDNNGEDIFGDNAGSRVVLSLTLGL